MLNTCKNTESPPQPRRKAVKIILIDIAFSGIKLISPIPFVISSKPVINDEEKDEGIFKILKIGDNMLDANVKM